MVSQPKPIWTLSKVVTALWVSFVFAGIATMLFFATFDPLAILAHTTFPLAWDSTTCYSVGFLLFWLLTSTCSMVTVWLLGPVVPV